MNSEQSNPITLGITHARPPHQSFGIHQSDRFFHQYVIGQTGTGKTTLLENMIRQDTAAGQGLCLIDPHGDLAEAVSQNTTDTAIIWDVADPSSPYGYNPLTHVAVAYRPLVASGLIETLKKQWSDAWGVRMEHLLRYALLALLSYPHATLRDVIPLFLDKPFRSRVLATVTDEQVRHFWQVEYTAMNFKTAVDGVAPIANKLGAFLAHPLVRKAVCEPEQPLRFRHLMDQGTTLIVNLGKGRLGNDIANVVGGVIVSSITHAAYTRQDTKEAARRPYFLYLDEFHTLTSDILADMLSELRKYRVALVLAHQHTTQLSKEVLEAIIGNVGSLMVFRVGATDAGLLANQLAADIPTPRDLVNLPNYRMFVKLMIEGRQSKPFSAKTIAPLMPRVSVAHLTDSKQHFERC
ncbi:type IV secretory system conjugative DNA transfer family protein [Salaquimonas pukyongi]|uniref:type IV secretory system conjugative DNA transfer family protein n=1 Tax=Salaquimonas pukyongi TaxID=2712698 RepID=UPI00096BCCF7|nr:type IV secretion system DNA-binding domain-containing protein [Salaquimonas pukyongi]